MAKRLVATVCDLSADACIKHMHICSTCTTIGNEGTGRVFANAYSLGISFAASSWGICTGRPVERNVIVIAFGWVLHF